MEQRAIVANTTVQSTQVATVQLQVAETWLCQIFLFTDFDILARFLRYTTRVERNLNFDLGALQPPLWRHARVRCGLS